MNTTLRMKIVLPTSSADEQPVQVGVPGPVREVGSISAKEFLALRARQKAAAARARRAKRVILAVALTTATGGIALWRQHDRNLAFDTTERPVLKIGAPVVTRSVPSSAPVAGRGTAHAVAPSAATRPTTPPVAAVQSAAAQPTTAQPTIAAHLEDSAVAQCKLDFAQHQWRALLGSCTRAFAVTPDATVALRIAHGNFATGDTLAAGKWAGKALDLGSKDADAWVLVGHAERLDGHPRAAVSAYRHYLRAAPNGWHAHNVRAAIRALTPVPAPTPVPAEQPASEPSDATTGEN